MRTRPSRRSRPFFASATTRSRIAPTVSQATRISPATAVFDICLAHQPTTSSKVRVKVEAGRAHGTRSTTTPCSLHFTRGAAASTNTGVRPMSRARQRRFPPPESYPGQRAPHCEHRRRSFRIGRTERTSASPSVAAPFTTIRSTPRAVANTFRSCTSSAPSCLCCNSCLPLNGVRSQPPPNTARSILRFSAAGPAALPASRAPLTCASGAAGHGPRQRSSHDLHPHADPRTSEKSLN